jgi:uncharacterized protein YlxW (UPF0749 family)
VSEPDQPPRRHRDGRLRAGLARLTEGRRGESGLVWRLLVPLVFALAGVLFVTSAESADGDDLRPARATGLTELLEAESAAAEELQAEAEALRQQIDQLSASVDDKSLDELTEQVETLRSVSGLAELEGPGVEVVLDDAPYDQEVPPGRTANDLVVHQQDLQAVLNALWAGGAEGVTLQGQRIVTTTGIKCVGNTVLLHGVPYSPPYVFVAVGDVEQITNAVNSSEYIQIYKQYTAPPINIGWSFEVLSEVTLPAYDGPLELEYAEVVG